MRGRKLRKPRRDNPKIFTKSENMFLKSEKIFQIVIFLEIIVEEFIKSEKLLQVLIKILNPQILFCKSQTNLQIQELSLNPVSEKIFCHVLLAPAVCQRQRFAASKMAEFCVSCLTRVDQAKVSRLK